MHETVLEEGVLRPPSNVEVPDEHDGLARFPSRLLHACVQRLEESGSGRIISIISRLSRCCDRVCDGRDLVPDFEGLGIMV